MTGNDARSPATDSDVSATPRVFHGLYLGTEASAQQWLCLPTPLPPSIAERNAEEDDLRLRFGLPPREYYETALRSEEHWDKEGASQAVSDESDRLLKRRSELGDDGVSVGFARGFGFAFALKHNSTELIEYRNAETRGAAPSRGGSDFYLRVGAGGTRICEAGMRAAATENEEALAAVLGNGSEQLVVDNQSVERNTTGSRSVPRQEDGASDALIAARGNRNSRAFDFNRTERPQATAAAALVSPGTAGTTANPALEAAPLTAAGTSSPFTCAPPPLAAERATLAAAPPSSGASTSSSTPPTTLPPSSATTAAPSSTLAACISASTPAPSAVEDAPLTATTTSTPFTSAHPSLAAENEALAAAPSPSGASTPPSTLHTLTPNSSAATAAPPLPPQIAPNDAAPSDPDPPTDSSDHPSTSVFDDDNAAAIGNQDVDILYVTEDNIAQQIADDALLDWEDDDADNPSDEDAQDNIPHEVTTVDNALRDSERAKVFRTLHELLKKLREHVAANVESAEVPFFEERVSGSQLCAMYQGSNVRAPVRTVAIYLDLPRKLDLCTTRAACVRFMVSNNSITAGLPMDDSDLIAACSCSPLIEHERCEHIQLIARSAALRNEVKFILSLNVRSVISETPENWWARPIGERKKSAKAAWLVARFNATSPLMINFIPVLESAAAKRASQPIERRLSCKRCRLTAQQRGLCEHELTIAAKVHELEGEENEDTEPPDTPHRLNQFTSILPRRMFPCQSDEVALNEINARLFDAQAKRRASNQVDANGEGVGGLARIRIDMYIHDFYRNCRHCGHRLVALPGKENCTRLRRETVLHTVLYGSAWIVVYDLRCWKCHHITRFDGREHALFCFSKLNVYSREILDVLVYQICMLGETFRAGYELMRNVSTLPSIRSARRGGFPLSCRRRTTSDAFAAFMRTIEYPKEEFIGKIFRCHTCESTDAGGVTRLDGIVMDGTATGILGALPPFNRPSLNVNYATDTAPHQFVIRQRYVRKFFSNLFRAGKKSGYEVQFSVELPVKSIADKVEYAIYDDLADELMVETEMSYLFPVLFEAPSLREELLSRKRGSTTPEKVTCIHKISRIPLRTTLCNVYYCFFYESIPVGIIPSSRHEAALIKICVAMESFLQCSHFDSIPNGFDGSTCVNCAISLGKVGEDVFNLLPQVGNFLQMVTEGIFEKDNQPYRMLIHFVHKLLSRSLDILAGYKARFHEKEAMTAIEYNLKFKEPDSEEFRQLFSSPSLPNSTGSATNNSSVAAALHPESPTVIMKTLSNCEAAETGELFPGRKLIRPRLRFKNRAEDLFEDACVKDYTFSNRHTPGLFTVQCACEKPKLFGVVVMREAESLSTALSSIITRFNPLPRTIYYDNACNLSHSVALRFPWIFEESKFLCDRFHYLSHNCSSAFDPDSYKVLDPSKTSSAEAINKSWKISRTHVRFLNGLNLIPFLYCRSFFINLRAHLKENGKRGDVEDKDAYAYANELMPCDCYRCRPTSDMVHPT